MSFLGKKIPLKKYSLEANFLGKKFLGINFLVALYSRNFGYGLLKQKLIDSTLRVLNIKFFTRPSEPM
jgi:hypothetical protein